jgi:uncharacterized protein YbjT (DUF2867 family)
MLLAVAGGTGTVGRELVARLVGQGHTVRVLTRRAGAELPGGATHHRVDLATGAGLAPALEGVDAVVDAANAGPARKPAEAVLLGGTRRLLEAEAAAGVAHHVGVSVVGIDRVPYGYYAVKLAQEEIVRTGPVAWTIVRATQFFGLLDWAFSATARVGLLPGPALPLQPVDQREVAGVLAATAAGEPLGAITEFAGPEVCSVRDLAATWRAGTAARALVVPVPLPGRAGRALRSGGLTSSAASTGSTTFAAWLRERGAANERGPEAGS